jgi:hypothetical protein
MRASASMMLYACEVALLPAIALQCTHLVLPRSEQDCGATLFGAHLATQLSTPATRLNASQAFNPHALKRGACFGRHSLQSTERVGLHCACVNTSVCKVQCECDCMAQKGLSTPRRFDVGESCHAQVGACTVNAWWTRERGRWLFQEHLTWGGHKWTQSGHRVDTICAERTQHTRGV